MYFYNKLKTFLKKPGSYFRYKKKFLRNFYFQFSKFLHFKTYFSRVNTKNFPKIITNAKELIDNNEGFKLINASKLNEKETNVNEVLKKINYDLKKIDLTKLNYSDEGIIKLKTSKDFNNESPEFKFVTNKYLIEIVSRYLKCIPILTNLSLWYSPNKKFIENSSQEYHLDHEDYRQVKGFLFIDKINLDNGPLSIINVLQSENIQKSINYKMTNSGKRVNDKIIIDLKRSIEIKENIIIGEAGDLLLCDTSSCFHYGSRLGNRPRLILAFQYTTPFNFFMDWNWMKSERLPYKDLKFETNSLVRQVIGNKI